MSYYYHYTDHESAQSILATGVIVESVPGTGGVDDAQLGCGVYLTTLNPRFGAVRIAKNNWGEHAWKAQLRQGKVKWYCLVRISDLNDNLEDCCDQTGRDVFIYRGDLKLRTFRVQDVDSVQNYRKNNN